jgi:hypothetical protein
VDVTRGYGGLSVEDGSGPPGNLDHVSLWVEALEADVSLDVFFLDEVDTVVTKWSRSRRTCSGESIANP